MISPKRQDSIFYPIKFSISRVLEMLSEKRDVHRIHFSDVDKPVRFVVKQKRINLLAHNPVCCKCGKRGVIFRLATDLHSHNAKKSYYTAKLHLYAGDGDYLNIDHIIPRSFGGGNHEQNLQVMCHTCNQAKADHLPTELYFGDIE